MSKKPRQVITDLGIRIDLSEGRTVPTSLFLPELRFVRFYTPGELTNLVVAKAKYMLEGMEAYPNSIDANFFGLWHF